MNMTKGFTWALIAIFSVLNVGCGTIRNHRILEEPQSTTLTTSIGGTIFRLNKSGDLPNAFGGRDIWGGKVDKGHAEMKLVGIKGAVLVLEVIDVNKSSSETTMDRYEPFAANPAVTVHMETNVSLGDNSRAKPYVFEFDTKVQKDIVIAGIRVTFLEVQPYSILYTLNNMTP